MLRDEKIQKIKRSDMKWKCLFQEEEGSEKLKITQIEKLFGLPWLATQRYTDTFLSKKSTMYKFPIHIYMENWKNLFNLRIVADINMKENAYFMLEYL